MMLSPLISPKFALTSLLVALALGPCLPGCSKPKSQEDADNTVKYMETMTRFAQKNGVRFHGTLNYGGAAAFRILGPGGELDTGIRLSADFDLNPSAAIDRATVDVGCVGGNVSASAPSSAPAAPSVVVKVAGPSEHGE